ncbi:MAG: hypothetical protein IKE95_04940, partial [Methanobrevibacter sp.]|nr:hypothetical protein [Methanobrevibacter sp.]
VEMRCKRDSHLLQNTIQELKNKNNPDDIEEIINEIINLFIYDSELLELTNCDIPTLRQIVQIYVFEHQELRKVNELTKTEKDNIIDDILIECVKYNAQK